MPIRRLRHARSLSASFFAAPDTILIQPIDCHATSHPSFFPARLRTRGSHRLRATASRSLAGHSTRGPDSLSRHRMGQPPHPTLCSHGAACALGESAVFGLCAGVAITRGEPLPRHRFGFIRCRHACGFPSRGCCSVASRCRETRRDPRRIGFGCGAITATETGACPDSRAASSSVAGPA